MSSGVFSTKAHFSHAARHRWRGQWQNLFAARSARDGYTKPLINTISSMLRAYIVNDFCFSLGFYEQPAMLIILASVYCLYYLLCPYSSPTTSSTPSTARYASSAATTTHCSSALPCKMHSPVPCVFYCHRRPPPTSSGRHTGPRTSTWFHELLFRWCSLYRVSGCSASSCWSVSSLIRCTTGWVRLGFRLGFELGFLL